MDEKQLQQQLTALVQAATQGDQQAIQQIQQIMQAAQQGDQQAVQIAQMIQTIAESMKQKAKFGAKLNYIRTLKGKCPDGYETAYFKCGGRVKRTCKKCQQGAEFTNDVIGNFKAKCGKKMKKITKKEQGGKYKRPTVKNDSGWMGTDDGYERIKTYSDGTTSSIYDEGNASYATGRNGITYNTRTASGLNKVDSIRRVDGFGNSPIIRNNNWNKNRKK